MTVYCPVCGYEGSGHSVGSPECEARCTRNREEMDRLTAENARLRENARVMALTGCLNCGAGHRVGSMSEFVCAACLRAELDAAEAKAARAVEDLLSAGDYIADKMFKDFVPFFATQIVRSGGEIILTQEDIQSTARDYGSIQAEPVEGGLVFTLLPRQALAGADTGEGEGVVDGKS